MSTSESKKTSSSKHSKEEHQEEKNVPDIPVEEVMKNTFFFLHNSLLRNIPLYINLSVEYSF